LLALPSESGDVRQDKGLELVDVLRVHQTIVAISKDARLDERLIHSERMVLYFRASAVAAGTGPFAANKPSPPARQRRSFRKCAAR
jgi:hypothetical protein